MDPAYSGPEMKARGATGDAVGRRLPDVEARLQEDPFFYGYRWVGGEQVPLTADDLLLKEEREALYGQTQAVVKALANISTRRQ